jgi:hypothetical protein
MFPRGSGDNERGSVMPMLAFARLAILSLDGAADPASPLLQSVAHPVEMDNLGGLHIEFDTKDVPATILPERTAPEQSGQRNVGVSSNHAEGSGR